MTIFAMSPLEQFEIIPLISMSLPLLGSLVVSLTNIGLYSIITLVLVVGLHLMANNSYRLVPGSWSISMEALVVSLAAMVRDQIGSRYEIYTPFIHALFMFVLVANVNGNIPYGFTLTTSGIAALGLSVFVFIAVTIIGIYKHGIHFASFFVPGNTPVILVSLLTLIETVSYFARSLSLGVRLWSNMVAGHTLLKILSTFLTKLFTSGVFVAILTLLPFAVFVALIGLEMAVSLIQSYVFCVLTSAYLKDAEQLH
jgi:F-type H+-transporting ATPase subunit a